MRHWVAATVAIAALALLGCATETVAGEEHGLVSVRKADYEGKVFYYDRSISPRPLTAEEIGDTTSAIPVVVKFFDSHAVAFWAPQGEPRFDVEPVAAWVIAAHIAEPLDGDGTVAPPDPGTTTTHSDDVIESVQVEDLGVDATAPAALVHLATIRGVYADLPLALLDWFSDAGRDFTQIFGPGFHPGCL